MWTQNIIVYEMETEDFYKVVGKEVDTRFDQADIEG